MIKGLPENRRIYGIIRAGEAGRMMLQLTAHDQPDTTGAMGVLIWRGALMQGIETEIEIVSDPKQDPDLTGPAGPNGWTPVIVGEADGTRTLMKVADWIGGKGAKPSTGYIGPAGATGLVAKAAAFNFNAIKRADIFTGISAANGIATIVFEPPFAAVPAKALPQAVPNLLAGPVKAELVAGSLTKTGCQVKVTTAALVTGVVTALAGASVTVIAIEA